MVTSISPQQARELIDTKHLDVVDVRDPAEWSRGHLPGARLVPLAVLRSNPQAALPHDGVIFICAAGIRSQTAARVAEQHGFRNVYSVVGGTNSWQRAGLPLVVASDADAELHAAAA
jgi:rhodanese-related sulfurtransferase